MKDIYLPEIIFGTSGLGNLYVALNDDIKRAIIKESMRSLPKPVVFDSAGKYGAGLALECLGRFLNELNVAPQDVLISNKLGWLRTELKSAEPSFEPGIWKGLKHDAVQNISYDGIMACYYQGNELLKHYAASLVSVHDPDEYLLAAVNDIDYGRRYNDILEAYRALKDLKKRGEVKAIGVGAKDWRVIKKIAGDIELDWVMIANSMTIHSHPQQLFAFMEELENKGVAIINAAVFNAGFLTGGSYYNYRLISPDTPAGAKLFAWRNRFNAICADFSLQPAAACIKFGLSAPGVTGIAVSATSPGHVHQNVALAGENIPELFWEKLSSEGLIDPAYLHRIIAKQ